MPAEDLGNKRSHDGLFNKAFSVLPNIGQTLADCDAYADAVCRYLKLKDAGDMNAVRPEGFMDPEDMESSDTSEFRSSDLEDEEDDEDDEDYYDDSELENSGNGRHYDIARIKETPFNQTRKISVVRKSTGGNILLPNIVDKPASDKNKTNNRRDTQKTDTSSKHSEEKQTIKKISSKKIAYENKIKSKPGSIQESNPDNDLVIKAKSSVESKKKSISNIRQLNTKKSSLKSVIDPYSIPNSRKQSLRENNKSRRSLTDNEKKSNSVPTDQYKQESNGELENKSQHNIVIHRRSLDEDSKIKNVDIKPITKRLSNSENLLADLERKAINSLQEDRQKALNEIGENLHSLNSIPFMIHNRIKDNLDNKVEEIEILADHIDQQQVDTGLDISPKAGIIENPVEQNKSKISMDNSDNNLSISPTLTIPALQVENSPKIPSNQKINEAGIDDDRLASMKNDSDIKPSMDNNDMKSLKTGISEEFRLELAKETIESVYVKLREEWVVKSFESSETKKEKDSVLQVPVNTLNSDILNGNSKTSNEFYTPPDIDDIKVKQNKKNSISSRKNEDDI